MYQSLIELIFDQKKPFHLRFHLQYQSLIELIFDRTRLTGTDCLRTVSISYRVDF